MIPGAVITLDKADCRFHEVTKTDANGFYEFLQLAPAPTDRRNRTGFGKTSQSNAWDQLGVARLKDYSSANVVKESFCL